MTMTVMKMDNQNHVTMMTLICEWYYCDIHLQSVHMVQVLTHVVHSDSSLSTTTPRPD